MVFNKGVLGRKAQAAAGTAVLLAVIAALIIMFIILIPPKERAKLLGEESGEGTAVSTQIEEAPAGKNLLEVSPGRVDYLAEKEIEHPLPVVNIFTKTEAKVLAEKNVAYAKKGAFSEETDQLSFEVADLKHTENVLLNMNVIGGNGNLIIKLNEEEIYNAEVKAGSLTVPVPKNLLKEKNVLLFAVSSPGVAFWATNDVSLEKIKVVADVTNLDAQYSKNMFIVSETEKKNMEKAVLEFQPGCNIEAVGKLAVTLNGANIYSAVPDCELGLTSIEIAPEKTNQGENQIIFYTEKGSYLLSHIVVKSELKEVEFPAYYFELSYDEYKDVQDEKKRVRLTIEFVDVVMRKFGDITFNGLLSHFDTKEATYTQDLSEDVVQGTNALKIKPLKTLDIREVSVDLVS
ncbi:MAG: hypothetical protein AB1668_05815 [Nanoarchaeota archaeon]